MIKVCFPTITYRQSVSEYHLFADKLSSILKDFKSWDDELSCKLSQVCSQSEKKWRQLDLSQEVNFPMAEKIQEQVKTLSDELRGIIVDPLTSLPLFEPVIDDQGQVWEKSCADAYRVLYGQEALSTKTHAFALRVLALSSPIESQALVSIEPNKGTLVIPNAFWGILAQKAHEMRIYQAMAREMTQSMEETRALTEKIHSSTSQTLQTCQQSAEKHAKEIEETLKGGAGAYERRAATQEAQLQDMQTHQNTIKGMIAEQQQQNANLQAQKRNYQ